MDHLFWSHLAFSTFQHRLASFNLPKIPIFVLARPVSAFPGRQSRSFPVFTRKIPAMAPRAFHPQNIHSLHCTDTALLPRPTYTSFARVIFNHFRFDTAWRRLYIANHTTLLNFFAGTYLIPVIGDLDNISFSAKPPSGCKLSLSHLFVHTFQKLFASSWVERELWGWLYLYCTKISVHTIFLLHMSGRKKRAVFLPYLFFSYYTTRHYPFSYRVSFVPSLCQCFVAIRNVSVDGRDHVCLHFTSFCFVLRPRDRVN